MQNEYSTIHLLTQKNILDILFSKKKKKDNFLKLPSFLLPLPRIIL